MKIKKITVKFILDICMACLLILMYSKNVINLAFHEFGGLFLCVLFVFHSVINGKWVAFTAKKLFSSQIPIKAKLGFLVDSLLGACFIFIALSGILISKKAFPALASGALIWKKAHFAASAFAVVFIGVHIGLHWSFIKSMMVKIVKIPAGAVKPLAAVLLCGVVVFGSYNVWTSNFKRWITIPFEQTINAAGADLSSARQSSEAKLFDQNGSNGQIVKETGSATGFQHPAQQPFSFFNVLNLFFVFGSILALIAVFTAAIEFRLKRLILMR